MTRAITYNTAPGGYYIFIPTLLGANILSVDRTGFGRDEAPFEFPAIPSNTEFIVSGARLVFDPNIPFTPGEKINVLYEI